MYVLVDSTLISVVTPIHTTNHKLPQIRKALSSSTEPIQLILVLNNPKLVKQIIPQASNEIVVVAPRKGRGFALLQGIAKVTGNITLLLHSDTIPRIGWDRAILSALEDPRVVGGGFSITYDTPNPYLEILSWLSNQWVRISGELYGDRAMFIRSQILKRCMSVLEVPLFEDLRLAKCMHRHGRVVVLKEEVETSAEGYRNYGIRGYIGKIWFSRLWYAMGGAPFQIYREYYSTKKRV